MTPPSSTRRQPPRREEGRLDSFLGHPEGSEGSGRGNAPWRIWIDTGGTFTDCLALDPAGEMHRVKVLSSGGLRGRVAERLGPRRVRVEGGWAVPRDFFRGFELRALGGVALATVMGSEPGGTALELDRAVGELGPGEPFELQSPEEAPVLAARLATGTPTDRPLPAIALRLATTRGTNALLERKGSPTAFFVTRGFGDLLVIGTQQRPDLFALDIRKPPPLYEAVVEVPERLAADGSVLVPLEIEALRAEALGLMERGIEAAAVALLHSYRNPAHEEALGDALRRWGFRHVALSSRLAPLIKILPRAQTAVVDAYLSGSIRGYLERVASALPAGSLHVMTSAGGLVRAGSFHPKDSLLSGPAGGVVGAALAGRRSGLARVIAFDMGGTSTDVARYDGEYEYRFEHRVGDAHLVAPALAIESVAAGGGSVCGFDGTLKVGPESTGARPGPACYGAGGPLTLTDVNLLMGRLDPGRFEIPLDPGAAELAFATLALRVAEGAGEEPAREELLQGLLDIADERMAGAIRRISVARGIDPADHALVAFGGAGGQHACAVAALLGIARVLVPADAGLLSAAGLGAAVVERFVERQVLAPLAEVGKRISSWLADLGREAVAAVEAEGVPGEEIEVRRRVVEMRFAGQEATLAVEHRKGAAIERSFLRAYEELYGYRPEGRAVEVVALRAVASSRSAPLPPPAAPPLPHATAATAHRRACFGRRWLEVPAFDRPALAPGATFAGPCLVFERHGATVLPEGWNGHVDAAGALLLEQQGM
jgi:5-oxoprolinase (ATP-hydrolysing)